MNKRVALIALILICALLVGVTPVRHMLWQGVTAVLPSDSSQPSPPVATTTDTPPPNGFNILLHIGAQIEPLANTSNTGQQQQLKSIVDGYYLFLLNAGALKYWPTRPIQCSLLFQRISTTTPPLTIDGTTYANPATLLNVCRGMYLDYWRPLYIEAHPDPTPTNDEVLAYASGQHEDAMVRVLTNLDIKNEQQAGKKVMAEVLLHTDNFTYTSSSDTLRIVQSPPGNYVFPKIYSFLTQNLITPNQTMTYQEPGIQVEQGSAVKIPKTPGGTDVAYLPTNTRIIDLLDKAYVNAGKDPSPKISIDIREWVIQRGQASVTSAIAMGYSNFVGVTFEMSHNAKASFIANNAKGIAWLLTHTPASLKINILMPASLADTELDTEVHRDTAMIANMRSFILDVDGNLKTALGQTSGHPLCNSRISIIVGSYGGLLHPQTLPINRTDSTGAFVRRAGTVGGEILELSRMRENLCGGSATPNAPTATP